MIRFIENKKWEPQGSFGETQQPSQPGQLCAVTAVCPGAGGCLVLGGSLQLIGVCPVLSARLTASILAGSRMS